MAEELKIARSSAESLAPLVARELKGKRQFCSIVTLDENGDMLQRWRFDKKQMPGKLHVEDHVFSNYRDLKYLSKNVKTIIIGSVNSFCLSGNRNDKSRCCCMNVLADWHKKWSNVRLILVYKKPYEVDKSLVKNTTFEHYLTKYFQSKFDCEKAELLKWNGEIAVATH